MDNSVKNELIKVVGRKNFTDAVVDLISYAKDASMYAHRPDAGVWPVTTDQVVRIMALANDRRIPVTPRGAGTGLSAGAVPMQAGIVMDLCRMNKILEIAIPDRLAVVQPGVVYADLEKALAPFGFFFPPDPSSGRVATLGGNVAVNAGGLKGAKYGTTKDYVLALEVVLPDGRIMHTGARTMKSVSGYDLTRLFVGSEGTLGIITEITLKINPKPPETSTALAAFNSMADAGRAVRDIMISGIVPSALEYIDHVCLDAIRGASSVNIPVSRAVLLSETDGYTQDETEFQMGIILDIFKKNKASMVRKAVNKEEAGALWAARKLTFGALSRINYNLFGEDVAVPMSRLPELIDFISELSEEYKLKIPCGGHAGDGNLHPAFSIDGTDGNEIERMEAACSRLLQKVIQLGGTIAAEHGVGLSKAQFLPLEQDEASMQTMRDLKRLFDPNNILNPGKLSLDE